MEEAGKAMAYFRDEVKKAGFPDLHLQQCGGNWKRSASEVAQLKKQIELFGVNSFSFYNMGGFDTDYIKHGMNGISLREEWEKQFELPVFPTVSVGWDSTPRFLDEGAEKITCWNHTPEAFASFLQTAKEWADSHADTQPKFITINAWNEYVEGSYLLPDRRNGFSYLQAVRDVLDGKYENK